MDVDVFGLLPTDELFPDSPNAGDPACTCSRCGRRIYHTAVRTWQTDADGEYRFHPECLGMHTGQSTLVPYSEDAPDARVLSVEELLP